MGLLPELLEPFPRIEPEWNCSSSTHTTAHLYLSSADASALLEHADKGDVLVLQVAGSKDWTYAPVSERHAARRDEAHQSRALAREHATLTPGSAMRVPAEFKGPTSPIFPFPKNSETGIPRAGPRGRRLEALRARASHAPHDDVRPSRISTRAHGGRRPHRRPVGPRRLLLRRHRGAIEEQGSMEKCGYYDQNGATSCASLAKTRPRPPPRPHTYPARPGSLQSPAPAHPQKHRSSARPIF